MAATSLNLLELFPEWWLDATMAEELLRIDRLLDEERSKHVILPERDSIFNALRMHPSEVRVVVVGQDPYPTPGHATGYAFASPKGMGRLPASLRNIFRELKFDLGVESPDPSLNTWHSQGVLLLNRILTVREGEPLSHERLGWEIITERIIRRTAENGAVGLLWGKQARVFEPLFHGRVVSGVHPSPLSAHRGFFGSKPFSRVNELLEIPIAW